MACPSLASHPSWAPSSRPGAAVRISSFHGCRRAKFPMTASAALRLRHLWLRFCAMSDGTAESPWTLTTPSGQSEYQAWRDEAADPPALVVQVGKSQLRCRLEALDD